MYRNLAIFPLNFGQIMSIENLKKHMFLALFIFLLWHFGYIDSQPKKRQSAFFFSLALYCSLESYIKM
jgi:hypothetical protein